ncbi:MAG: hypothetical protein RLY86_3682 [Pseudomonadota bacterium]
MVEEAFRPGVVMTEVARRLGVHESLLYRWRRLMRGGPSASTAVPVTFAPVQVVGSDPTPTPSPPPSAVASPSAAVPPASCIVVEMPNGVLVHLSGPVDPGLAAATVRAAGGIAG